MQNAIDYEARYDQPADVLDDRALSYASKRAILHDWRFDARRRSESAAEGLESREHPPLRAVCRALELLENSSGAAGVSE